nr:decarboxylase orsb [Quercus suber]
MPPPMITLEEHFLSEVVGNRRDTAYVEQINHIPGLREALYDVDELRLESMDKNHVSLQVVSHAPGKITTDDARQANDQLAAAIKKHPTRFAGFAVLAVSDAVESARELERVVTQHGFVGALVDNHDEGRYFDGDEYDVLWRACEQLDVPLYIHPTWPSDDMKPRFAGNFSTGAQLSLGTSGFGWHSDVALHTLRLFAAGVFDRFPRLKIIIGHFGEMLPFMLARVEHLSQRWGPRQRAFKQVWDENLWITTSGVWSLDPLRCILGNTKIDHILYSVDYPFAKNEWGLEWMKELEASGLVSQEQLEMIAYKNAEKLLKIRVQQE